MKRLLILVALCLVCVTSFAQGAAQGMRITGKVTDSFGDPLPGVGVRCVAAGTGSVTDLDGNYSVYVRDESEKLEFSFIGMITQTLPVNGVEVLNVVMKEDAIGLQETVVIGYGSMHKEEITTSIVRVKSDEFVKGGVSSPLQLIQGKVAGLGMAVTSGDPAASPSISLRGISTLAASSSPLIVIDGIVGGSLNSVSPEDIASIDVLKDGSAAAIYGTRGTNGVIIITTKSTGSGMAEISYEGYVKADAIEEDNQRLTAAEWRAKMSDPDIQAALKKARISPQDYGETSDWVNAITRNPISHNHHVSLKGGNATTNYIGSATYSNKQGIYENSYDESLSIKLKVDHSMFDGKLKASVNISDRLADHGYVPDELYDNASKWNPTFPMYDSEGNYYMTNSETPVCTANEWRGIDKYNQLAMSGRLALNLIPELTLSVTGSYQGDFNNNEWWGSHKTYDAVYGGKKGYANLKGGHGDDRTIEIQADWAKNFREHNVSATAGYSYNKYVHQDWGMTAYDFPVDGFGVWNIGTANSTIDGLTNINSYKWERKLAGFYGRVNYSYANKYLFMASLRREGSDKFGANNRWGWFPAVSAGWRISREEFMAGVKCISDLKLRAGYGVTGTEPASAYQYTALYNFSTAYMSYVNGMWVNGIIPSNNPNPDLKWEEKHEVNLGLDYALFDSRIFGSIEAYYRFTKDLLYTYTVPTPPNITNNMLANVGSLSNKGVELSLNADIVKSRDLSWTVGTNVSYNANKLVSLSNEQYTLEYLKLGNLPHVQTYSHRIDPGEPIGDFYGWKQLGLKGSGSSWRIEGAENSAAGEDQKTILGNGIPKMFCAFNTSVTYKKVDFSMSLRGAFMYSILNQYRMMYETLAWVQTYNVPKSAYEKVGDYYNYAPSTYCDYYIEPGGYLKLDNVTLGYTFGKDMKYLKNARVYLTGRNLLTFTRYMGMDPEAVNITGLTPGVDKLQKYPTLRSVTAGVSLTF